MDSYCTKCSLQFGNMTDYNMHLSIVHKENLEIKQEPSCDILEKDSDPFHLQPVFLWFQPNHDKLI